MTHLSVRDEKTANAGWPESTGRCRVVIESIEPSVDCGRFPIKRVLGESVQVEATVFADGHDALAADLLWREQRAEQWNRVPMRALGNDRWQAEFHVTALGRWAYAVHAWIDHFASWRNALEKRKMLGASGAPLEMVFRIGAAILDAAVSRSQDPHRQKLQRLATVLLSDAAPDQKFALALDPEVATVMRGLADPALVTKAQPPLAVVVERERARHGAWYEMFPRSAGPPGLHGTFQDCIARLPYVAAMGFDILYLPPIHPIGLTNRKGKNNAIHAQRDDVGSPWAIGSPLGGHKAIEPLLGSLGDFRQLLQAARTYDIEIAMDVAFQCSPDHPYISEHPDWFKSRPDGTLQYAENPPKEYQDIYPLSFETPDWMALWKELKSILDFWIAQGVRIFRVDNPHTKALPFWEWLLPSIQASNPDTIFLSEAFTRPALMHRLAKCGFSQSYTYFTWRTTKSELISYFSELTSGKSREYFRPNVWPNTPDILHAYLQNGSRPAFVIRLVLAATLSANYGIYGPPYELCENEAAAPESEEYLNSEKYQIRVWNLDFPDSLKDLIARINSIRRATPALQHDWTLRFLQIDNDNLIAYSKHHATEDGVDWIVIIVNLDYQNTQSGWLELPLSEMGLSENTPYQMHDLLSNARYTWRGSRNFVQLDPSAGGMHLFRIRRHERNENQFDYFS